MDYRIPGCSHGRIPIERIVLAAVIVGVGIWFCASRMVAVPYSIYVDGKYIATVESLGSAKQVLEEVKLDRAPGIPTSVVHFVQTVGVRRASKNCEFLDIPEAKRALEKASAVEAKAYTIMVNGRPIVALASREDAAQALELVKQHYQSTANDPKSKISFKERVDIDRDYVSLDMFRSTPDEAAEVLTSSAAPTVYTISTGDRAAKLAFRYKVSLEELAKINPGKNLNRLIEGDQLTVCPAKTPVTVVTRSLIEKSVTVTPPSEGRRRGRRLNTGNRQMQVQVTYENGVQVGEQVLSQITTWDRPKGQAADGVSDYGSDEGQSSGYRHYRHSRRSRHYHHKPKPSSNSDSASGNSDTPANSVPTE